MKYIVSSYTDIGNPATPRRYEIDLLGVELLKRGELKEVICRGVSRKQAGRLDRAYVRTPIPFGSLLPQALSFLARLFPQLPARYLSIRLFDRLAKPRIRDADVLVCCDPLFVDQLREAKRNGILTVVIASVAHINYHIRLSKEEHSRYGIPFRPQFAKFEEDVKICFAEADIILPRSEFAERSLLANSIPRERIYAEYIWFYADERFKPAMTRPDRFRVMYTGSVVLEKGVQYLLEAWQRLKIPDAELLIAGSVDPEFRKAFARYWADLSIRFLGHVDPLPYLQRSSVFCFPSLSEGCPQAIIEAMACGLPVIATENSGSVARHGKEGYIVHIRDSAALAERIRYLYRNPAVARRLGGSGVARAAQFTPERYAQNLARILRRACAKRFLQKKLA